ncbi:GNAT family N-acetyltransferase [Desulfovibrio oxyclinae]|uniref:GNAT family N-acetyltransferase n=1 Tax=Desulfovibrio oxyclinae TaxID=63560 RepID=UPI000367EBC8|nr:GNAT family N-acetyltransferase [Desulfovibrio oxyclinae]
MTAIIRAMEMDDVEEVCNLLHNHMNPDFSPERWSRLFVRDWCIAEPELGLVVEDKGEIVGFHGHVCSRRCIGNEWKRFVNFTSWYLRKEYRGQGLGTGLVKKAIERRDTTYTVFSLSPKRIELFRKLGLQPLDTQRLVWSKRDPQTVICVDDDPESIRWKVECEHSRVMLDNLPFNIKPYLVSTNCNQCLLITNEAIKNGGVHYHDVLYRSNPAFLAAHAQDIANALLRDDNHVLAADKRFHPGPQPLDATVETIASPRFYLSEEIPAECVDLLYSELQLLDMKLD